MLVLQMHPAQIEGCPARNFAVQHTLAASRYLTYQGHMHELCMSYNMYKSPPLPSSRRTLWLSRGQISEAVPPRSCSLWRSCHHTKHAAISSSSASLLQLRSAHRRGADCEDAPGLHSHTARARGCRPLHAHRAQAHQWHSHHRRRHGCYGCMLRARCMG